MTEKSSFSYSRDTFPFQPDCYTWPQVAVVTEDMESLVLNIHCLRDMNRREFSLVGFIGMDREEQISQVIFLAKEIGAEVIAFKGVTRGFGVNGDKLFRRDPDLTFARRAVWLSSAHLSCVIDVRTQSV